MKRLRKISCIVLLKAYTHKKMFFYCYFSLLTVSSYEIDELKAIDELMRFTKFKYFFRLKVNNQGVVKEILDSRTFQEKGQHSRTFQVCTNHVYLEFIISKKWVRVYHTRTFQYCQNHLRNRATKKYVLMPFNNFWVIIMISKVLRRFQYLNIFAHNSFGSPIIHTML